MYARALTMSATTCSYGIRIIASTAVRVASAFTLNAENGAHVGICLHAVKKSKLYGK